MKAFVRLIRSFKAAVTFWDSALGLFGQLSVGSDKTMSCFEN